MSHQSTADVKATSCPLKGVSCRRVCESPRYRWHRRSLSDCASPSASRHPQPPSLAKAVPPQHNLLPPRPRLPTYPRRPTADRPGKGRPARTRAHRSRSSVRSHRLSLTHFVHAPRKSSSKPPWRLPPHPPTLPPNNPRPLRNPPRHRRRRRHHPRRPGHRSSAG